MKTIKKPPAAAAFTTATLYDTMWYDAVGNYETQIINVLSKNSQFGLRYELKA